MPQNSDPNIPSPTQDPLVFAQRMTHVSRLVTLGEMAAGLAHELNQPLSAIATYAMACDRLLAASDAPVSADVREAVVEINAQAQRAGEIIRRLRRLVRPRELQPKPADANELIRELWSLLESDARLHDVQMIFEPAAALPEVLVDGIRIQQVLFNLIHNAIEAIAGQIGGKRQIRVSTRRTGAGDIEISVCDSGPGVDPVILGRLFEPFSTTKPEGTGLGLAVGRSIVNAHRGKLEYRPNLPGGACFVLTLPIAAAQGRP